MERSRGAILGLGLRAGLVVAVSGSCAQGMSGVRSPNLGFVGQSDVGAVDKAHPQARLSYALVEANLERRSPIRSRGPRQGGGLLDC